MKGLIKCIGVMLAVSLTSTLTHASGSDETSSKLIALMESRYQRVMSKQAELDGLLAESCKASDQVKAAFHDSYDAWLGVADFQLQPLGDGRQSMKIMFWPDNRNRGLKALLKLIKAKSPVIESAETFASQGVAVKGYPALEILLFDSRFTDESDAYRCALKRVISQQLIRDIEQSYQSWKKFVPDNLQLFEQGRNAFNTELFNAMYQAIVNSLEFQSEMRLSLPYNRLKKNQKVAQGIRSGRVEHTIEVVNNFNYETLEVLLVEHPDSLVKNQILAQSYGLKIRMDLLPKKFLQSRKVALENDALIQSMIHNTEQLHQRLATETAQQLNVPFGFNELDGE